VRPTSSKRQLKPLSTVKLNNNLDIIQEQSYNSSNPYDYKIPLKKEDPYELKRQQTIAKKNEIMQKYGRKKGGVISKSQSSKRTFGVLGLDPLIDEEGSSAYFAGKDLEKETTGYSVRYLLPDLYFNYGKSKDEFDKLMRSKKFPKGYELQKQKEQELIQAYLIKKNDLEDRIEKSKVLMND
jgi:hypothetical protein